MGRHVRRDKQDIWNNAGCPKIQKKTGYPEKRDIRKSGGYRGLPEKHETNK